MQINQIIALLLTIGISLIGSWITIRVSIAELKRDIFHLREKIEFMETSKTNQEMQSKNDMKELKDDIKKIFEYMSDMKVQMARMEARNEGKDDVVNELKEAVTTILKPRR
jgi:predicted nuclease with TOPRIM domain